MDLDYFDDALGDCVDCDHLCLTESGDIECSEGLTNNPMRGCTHKGLPKIKHLKEETING